MPDDDTDRRSRIDEALDAPMLDALAVQQIIFRASLTTADADVIAGQVRAALAEIQDGTRGYAITLSVLTAILKGLGQG